MRYIRPGTHKYKSIQNEFLKIREMLGEASASEKAANIIVNFLISR
jgi:hypothetical protein